MVAHIYLNCPFKIAQDISGKVQVIYKSIKVHLTNLIMQASNEHYEYLQMLQCLSN